MHFREHALFAALVVIAGVATFACLNYFIATSEPTLTLSQPPPVAVIIEMTLVVLVSFAAALTRSPTQESLRKSTTLLLQGVCNGMMAGFILCVLELYASNTQEAQILRYRLLWHAQIHLVSWWAFAIVIAATNGGFVSGLGFSLGRKHGPRLLRKRV